MKKVSEVVQRSWKTFGVVWLLVFLGFSVYLGVALFIDMPWAYMSRSNEEYLMISGMMAGALLASQLPRVVSYIWLGQFKIFPTYD